MSAARHPRLSRRAFLGVAAAAGASALLPTMLSGCSADDGAGAHDEEMHATPSTIEGAYILDDTAWSFDPDADIYYQLGVGYCTAPATTDYETMAIYVPGAYMDAVDNGDGTFTCTPNTTGTVGSFTAETAPFVMPVNTAGYSAQAAPTEYSAEGVSAYLDAGFIYVFAGCRGRTNGYDFDGGLLYAGGAPWGVTDLKAAIRTLRYNVDVLPGDTGRIFAFGHSGGGAQSAVLGASGDADGYLPYLEFIGAPMKDADGHDISDAIYGAACWCPITCLDQADAAYEWNMGQFSSADTRKKDTFGRVLSLDLAAAFAAYVNETAFTDDTGKVLGLETTQDGIYLSGSYYDYLLGVIEDSLNAFLATATFPYTPASASQADMGAPGEMPSGGLSGEPPSDAPSGEASVVAENGDISDKESVTYQNAREYIGALNSETVWIDYDTATNTAKVKNLAGFVASCKPVTKDVGAFDALDLSSAENDLFGTSTQDKAHFDASMRNLLSDNADVYAFYSDWDDAYPGAYIDDFSLLDDLGFDVETRGDLYNPLYYLNTGYAGAGTSVPASRWRIRSGITQGDTALVTEMNLALSAASAVGSENVDFETVWGGGHAMVERVGTPVDNLIDWIVGCFAEPPEPEERVRSALP